MQQGSGRRLLGVRALAAALKEMGQPVSASTLSRGLARRHFTNHGTAAQPLLDLDEVINTRANLLDPDKQRAALIARGVLPPPTAASADDDDDFLPSPRLTSTEGKLGVARLRKAEAEAAQAEMDLMERQHGLAPTRDFSDAAFTLGALVRDSLAARVSTLAAAVAGKNDTREIALLISSADDALLTALASRAAKMAKNLATGKEAAPHDEGEPDAPNDPAT
ncbi:hypothetical protein [Nitrospirillum viridazoti]|uniref:Uncharacterized protein n=1 Tax=Nitrospirillum viridazoti CBAmc TaxID=1441467 RepID=A0A248JSB1_9PROT|nr:hypothetical protein [Nitrospirillum amazonense]ASG21400.1 hypothetical protein Y958_11600 [Nitrospirillum amazonense CBAmc]TWB33078.1 hypothetical protein FBZ91_115140 [Nitrospirillum amazonense]